MTAPRPGGTVFLLSHQNHYKCLLPVVEGLAESGHPVCCAVPVEAVAKGRLTDAQIDRLRRAAPLVVMPKGPLEAVLARLAPRAFPRPRRWAARLGRMVRRRGLRPATVALPFHLPNLQYVRAALGGGVRVVCIQHDPYHSTDAGDDLSGFAVDLYCTWGEPMKRLLRRQGVRQEIHVTGAPHLERRPARTEPFADDEPVRLLYATQPMSESVGARLSAVTRRMKRRAIADLLDAVGRLPRASLLVKLHPADEGVLEREAIAAATELAGRVELAPHDPDRSIYDYIDASDAVLTIYSTVAFEAVVRGKPIVLLDYDNIVGSNHRLFGEGEDFITRGVALAAVDGAELEAALRKVLYERQTADALRRSRRSFLARHLECDSREAQRRLCRVLVEAGRPAGGGPP